MVYSFTIIHHNRLNIQNKLKISGTFYAASGTYCAISATYRCYRATKYSCGDSKFI